MSSALVPLLLCLMLVASALRAQDPSYTLMYANPQTINPAMAGLTDGILQASAAHRVFRATENQNYVTSVFTADYAIRQPFLNGGVGLAAYTDYAGGLRTTAALLSFGYDVPLGVKVRYNRFRAGFQAGLVQRRLDDGNFLFADQFDGAGWNRPSMENLTNVTRMSADVSVGLLWYRTQKIKGNPEFNYYGGVAMQHLNRPAIAFYEGNSERLNTRFSAQAGGKLRTRTPFDANVGVLYFNQNTSNLVQITTYGRYVVYEDGVWFSQEKVALSAGAQWRPGQTIAPFMGVEYKGSLFFSFGYDFLISETNLVETSYGGLQVMVAYMLKSDKFSQPALPFPRF
jgi:type IX secretion system PorP/SprF family membrane protein